MPSEAIEATELIVTDAFHGGAEPQMELTRGNRRPAAAAIGERNRAGRDGLHRRNDGRATDHLGREAPIIRRRSWPAMDADEVIIWTDVDACDSGPRLFQKRARFR